MIGVGAIRRWTFLAVALGLASGVAAFGQPPPPPGGPLNFGFGPQDDQVVRFKAEFTPAAEGKPARLFITAVIEKGYHIYSITQAPGGPEATQIKLPPSPDYRVTGPFQASEAPHKKIEKVFKNLTVESHEGTITWHAPIEIAQGVDPAKLEIKGLVHVQPCDAQSCLMPTDYKFTARLGRGVKVPEEQLKAPAPGPTPPPPTSSVPPPAPKSADGLPWQPYTNLESFRQLVDPSFDPDAMSQYVLSQLNNSSLGLELIYAFLGGLILNIMPCVLPVIGLKVLSFVEQAGHSRWRAFTLNLWYSAGLLAVFLLLATLAVLANFGWGDLFQYAGFNVVVLCIVFAMGLSFLGVWEIPIPGFVGGSAASKLSK